MFKIGDKVRVNNNYHIESLRGKIGVVVGDTDKDYDLTVEFKHIYNCTHSCDDTVKSNKGRWFKNSEVSLVGNPTREIHITTKDTTTYGVLKEDGKVIKKSQAILHKDDEYNFEKGVDIVMDRLFDREVKEVKRKANVGEYIKVINARNVPTDNGKEEYKNGDILKVIESYYDNYSRYAKGKVDNGVERVVHKNEYVVLENYKEEITTKTLSVYTNEELLEELKRRMEK